MTDYYSAEAASALLSLARKQRELIDYLLDFETHTFREHDTRRKLFRRPKITEYERLLSEAEELRYRASSYASSGWWQIPWSEVEYVLCTVLTETKRDGGWRFESNLRGFSEDNIRYVISAEQGASQEFRGESIYQYDTVSPYSAQERADRMKRYDRATFDSYLYTAYMADAKNANIQSPLTSNVYHNVMDYYVSEGWMIDSTLRSHYEQKMYTDKYVEGAHAFAVSRRRVKGLFSVGKYSTDPGGQLSGFMTMDYEPVSISPAEYRQVLIERHEPGFAVFKLCEYIAGDNTVRSVPYSLFTELAGGNTDRDMLCLQSALLTLVAKKLIIA